MATPISSNLSGSGASLASKGASLQTENTPDTIDKSDKSDKSHGDKAEKTKDEKSHGDKKIFSGIFNKFRSDPQKTPNEKSPAKDLLAKTKAEVTTRVRTCGYVDVTEEQIERAVSSLYAENDVDKAMEYLEFLRESQAGTVRPYKPDVAMAGAENRAGVTCYLDALLFAMYARNEKFDCILRTELEEKPAKLLQADIRLYVNLLRSGKLIQTDLTERIQEDLANTGWAAAKLLEQQDTSEAFAHITNVLDLPLLPLHVDIFHHGGIDDADHRVTFERLLSVPLPEEDDVEPGKFVKLEECLEKLLNTLVLVDRPGPEKRERSKSNTVSTPNGDANHRDGPGALPGYDVHEGKAGFRSPRTGSTTSSNFKGESIASLWSDDKSLPDKPSAENLAKPAPNDVPEPDAGAQPKLDADASTDSMDVASSGALLHSDEPAAVPATVPAAAPAAAPLPSRQRKATFDFSELSQEKHLEAGPSAPNRNRSKSLIQSFTIDGNAKQGESSPTFLQECKRHGSKIVKAVTIPAWQVFRYLPWHLLPPDSQVETNADVVKHFNKQPVVGILLKRYGINKEDGTSRKNTTIIDVPTQLRLPFFMHSEENTPLDDELSLGYKLVLQSVVCHRGPASHQGHYVAFARVDPKILTENRRHEVDPPPDYEDDQWVKFDDLAEDSRVTPVDNIEEALKGDDMPYLLFYQIVPRDDLDGVMPLASEPPEPGPPSYADETGLASRPSPGHLDPSSAQSGSTIVASGTNTGPVSLGPYRSGRSSMDAALSLANGAQRPSLGALRRSSAAFITKSANVSPSITPEGGQSPVLAPADGSSTSYRLGRAAAMFSGKSSARSRPPSQLGEGRITQTISRLGSLVRSSKEPLRTSQGEPDSAATPMAVSLATTEAGPSAGNSPLRGQSLDFGPDEAGSIAQQLDGADERDHSNRHHHHFRSRSATKKKGKAVEAAASTTGSDDGEPRSSSKGGKGKSKNKPDLPERVCQIM